MSLILRLEMQAAIKAIFKRDVKHIGFVTPYVMENDTTGPLDDLNRLYTDSEPGRVFWGADEEIPDGGFPRVIVYGYDGLPMQPVDPPSLDYVPGPEHPSSLDYEDQPLPTDTSPAALSPGYVPDSNPEEDPEEDSEEHADYPADGWDGDDEPSDDDSNDDTDDDNEDPFEDEEDDDGGRKEAPSL
ncbi:hypothetical protein Tco_0522900 [Tanacetum coccineum]